MNVRSVLSLKLALAVAGVTLASCVGTGGGFVVRQIPEDVAQASYVRDVVLNTPPSGGVSREFRRVFDSRMKAELGKCFHGQRPLRLVVDILDYKRTHPLQTYLVGGQNRIRGTARLEDAQTGQVLGDYDIDRMVSGGGLVPAVAMSEAEEQMTRAFGDEVCKRAFRRF